MSRGTSDFPEIDYRPGHEIGPVRMQGKRGSGGGAELGVSEVFSEEEMPGAVPLHGDALGVDRLVR